MEQIVQLINANENLDELKQLEEIIKTRINSFPLAVDCNLKNVDEFKLYLVKKNVEYGDEFYETIKSKIIGSKPSEFDVYKIIWTCDNKEMIIINGCSEWTKHGVLTEQFYFQIDNAYFEETIGYCDTEHDSKNLYDFIEFIKKYGIKSVDTLKQFIKCILKVCNRHNFEETVEYLYEYYTEDEDDE